MIYTKPDGTTMQLIPVYPKMMHPNFTKGTESATFSCNHCAIREVCNLPCLEEPFNQNKQLAGQPVYSPFFILSE